MYYKIGVTLDYMKFFFVSSGVTLSTFLKENKEDDWKTFLMKD